MSTKLDANLLTLIGLLYESALDERLWAGMADNLAKAFGAPSTSLKIYHPNQANADILQLTGNFAVAATDLAWSEHWHRNDLWVQEATRRKLTGVGTSELLLSDAELVRTAYYNEWLRPLMIHSMVGALVPLGQDATCSIGIHRPQGSAHFTQDDVRNLNTLIPHLQLALRLRRHLHHTDLGMQALDQALDTTHLAIVAVTPEAKVLFANKAAENLLQQGGHLLVSAGRLCTHPVRDDAELRRQIRAATQLTPNSPPCAMTLGQGGPKPLSLAFVPLTHRAQELNTNSPATLVLIRGLTDPTDKSAEVLRQLFGLTPSESRVAIALAQGLALEDMARRFGIGLGTVRTHLKSAMAKTGTHRQPQLVALVWHSVGPLPLQIVKPAGG
jgi:DNA-binding CsgD family transcriptional regulator/PAS domain-containing protein